MTDSPEGYDPGPGPSSDFHEDGSSPVEPKRKRFRAFHAVRKIFRRKSKHKDESESKSHSTSELVAADGTDRRSGGGGSMSGDTPYSSGLSLSHDSIFALDSEERATSSRIKNQQQQNVPNASRRRLSVKGMKEELMNKLRARQESDDEDAGLPRSPCTSPTTAEVLQQGYMAKSCKFRNSDGSLLSMGSSETDNEEGALNPPRMIFDRRVIGDPELDLGPTMLLNHRAAHHRIAVKPHKNHAIPRHRRLQQVTSGSSLPTTPEDVEENTVTYKFMSTPSSSEFAQKLPSPKESSHSARVKQRTSSECESPTKKPSMTLASTKANKSDESALKSRSLVSNINSKSHAADRKLRHEITQYGQRISKKDFEDIASSRAASGEGSLDTSRGERERTPEDGDATTSCFGFGHKSRKDFSNSFVSAEPKTASAKKDSVDEPFFSKLFGSRLSGRKKKTDDRKMMQENLPDCLSRESRLVTGSNWISSRPLPIGSDSPKDGSPIILSEKHGNRVIISVKSETRDVSQHHSTSAVSSPLKLPRRTDSVISHSWETSLTESTRPRKLGNEVVLDSTEENISMSNSGELPVLLPTSRVSVKRSESSYSHGRSPRTHHLSLMAEDSYRGSEDRRYSSIPTSCVDGDYYQDLLVGQSDSKSSPDQENESFTRSDFQSSAFVRGTADDFKRKSVQHQLTKEDIYELEQYPYSKCKSLPQSETSHSPPFKPVRFSFGSAKDASSQNNLSKSPSSDLSGNTFSGDFVRVSVLGGESKHAQEEIKRQSPPMEEKVDRRKSESLSESSERIQALEQNRPAFVDVNSSPRQSPPRNGTECLASRSPSVSVLRLDVLWSEAHTVEKTDVEPAVTDANNSSTVTTPVIPSAQDADAVFMGKAFPCAFLADSSPDAGVGGAKAVLRRTKPRQSSNAEEPELFKVFHRRSLKLKDSDSPAVSPDEAKEEMHLMTHTPPTTPNVNEAVISVSPDSTLTSNEDKRMSTVDVTEQKKTEPNHCFAITNKQMYVQFSASRLAKSNDSFKEERLPSTDMNTSTIGKDRPPSVASVVRKLSSAGTVGKETAKVNVDHNDNVEGLKLRTASLQQGETTVTSPNQSSRTTFWGISKNRTDSQSSSDSLPKCSSSPKDESVVRNSSPECVEDLGETIKPVVLEIGSKDFSKSQVSKAVLPDIVRQLPSLRTEERAVPDVQMKVDCPLSGVAIRQKKDDTQTASVALESLSLKNGRQNESALLIEGNAKQSVGRSSKVLDLVRNFQKLQVT